MHVEEFLTVAFKPIPTKVHEIQILEISKIFKKRVAISVAYNIYAINLHFNELW